MPATTTTSRQLNNKISGAKTQLKTATGARRHELERYLEHLHDQRDQLPLERRLAELDDRIENLITAIAATFPIAKADTAWRNAQAGKRARRGLPPLRTAKQEARDHAERQLLDLIEAHADEPWAKRADAEIAEAFALRTQLLERAERRLETAA